MVHNVPRTIGIGAEMMSAGRWVKRGIALGNAERFEEAVAAYEKAISIDPCSVDAWYLKAVALDELRRDVEALEAYMRVIEISRSDDPLTQAHL
jgi:Flp pilus assembly protein TadD